MEKQKGRKKMKSKIMLIVLCIAGTVGVIVYEVKKHFNSLTDIMVQVRKDKMRECETGR